MGLSVHGSDDWFGGDSNHFVTILASSDRASYDGRCDDRCGTGTNQLAHRILSSAGRTQRFLHEHR